MYITISSDIVGRLNPIDLTVYAALMAFESESEVCAPTQRGLAQRARVSVKSVYNSLLWLNMVELVSWEDRLTDRGKRRVYTLSWEMPPFVLAPWAKAALEGGEV